MDHDVKSTNLNPSFSGDNDIDQSQGETILLLLLPFLWKKELATMSSVNKHLQKNSSRYLYYYMVRTYPEVYLTGSPSSIPEMVQMYLPPRIVLSPGFSPNMLRQRGRYSFPVPASQQPQIHCDPRVTDAFGSMTWSEKSKAIWEYACKVKFWFLSLTIHRAEEHEAFANVASGVAMSQGQPVQDMICVLCRGLDLSRDLENYPFFLQCLNQDEASKVKVCFYERIIKETVHQNFTTNGWPILLSQELLESLPPLSLLVSSD